MTAAVKGHTTKGITAKGSTAKRAVRGPSRRALALFSGLVVVLAALVVTVVVLTERADQVASFDDHPVSRDELVFHMRRIAPTVQNELRNEYHLGGAINWSMPVGDRTALQLLTSRALDEIWRDKATLVLAKENGLSDSVDYEDFIAELTAENKRRANAMARGETVYGVTEFSTEEFYSHRLTELTTGLRERLSAAAGNPLWVTDAEVRTAFDADRQAWSANATTYTYSQLVVPVPDGASTAYATGLKARVAAADRLADVAAAEPGARLTAATYDGGAATGLNAHDQDLIAVLGKLSPGQISAPVADTGQITYYELDGKTVDEDAAFADYSRRIRQSLVEKKLDQFLQRRVDDSTIDVDTAAVDFINAEDVWQ